MSARVVCQVRGTTQIYDLEPQDFVYGCLLRSDRRAETWADTCRHVRRGPSAAVAAVQATTPRNFSTSTQVTLSQYAPACGPGAALDQRRPASEMDSDVGATSERHVACAVPAEGAQEPSW